MQRITEFIRLGLTADLLDRIRKAARARQVGVNEFIRNAIEKYLVEERKARIAQAYANDRPPKWKKQQERA